MGKIIVLGCGLVGRTIVKDLAKNHEVCVVDLHRENIETVLEQTKIKFQIGDATDKKFLSSIVPDYDLVISAVPGYLGFAVLKNLIELGKNVVDIAFFPENAFELDELAKSKGVTCVVDSGIAPGLSNMIIGYYSNFYKVDTATIYVGGLPFERTLPFEYKAPFSPTDVLEEYIRPARYRSNGELITSDPLTQIEHLHFKGIGTLEAFLTDGLRTLLYTTDIPNLCEKTLRYPGYAEKILFLKECGFLSSDPVETKDGKVVPLHLLEKLLLPRWKLLPEDEEFTVMRIVLYFKENQKTLIYEVFDRTDEVGRDSSMGRTTGFVACAVANLLLQNRFEKSGIIPPEILARNSENFEYVLNYLKARNVKIETNEAKNV